MKEIGDDHELCDRPMIVSGKLKVVDAVGSRIKVVGNAQAYVAGRTYYVSGWIDRPGVSASCES